MAGRPGKPLIDPTCPPTHGLIAFSRASFATHSISLLPSFLPSFLLYSARHMSLASLASNLPSLMTKKRKRNGEEEWREGALSRIAGHVKAIPYASLHYRGNLGRAKPTTPHGWHNRSRAAISCCLEKAAKEELDEGQGRPRQHRGGRASSVRPPRRDLV